MRRHCGTCWCESSQDDRAPCYGLQPAQDEAEQEAQLPPAALPAPLVALVEPSADLLKLEKRERMRRASSA
jgi:hypothetical protein